MVKALANHLAQLFERRTTVREVEGSKLRLDHFKYLRIKYCLCNDNCKWLDSLDFLDKDDKP